MCDIFDPQATSKYLSVVPTSSIHFEFNDLGKFVSASLGKA